MKTIILKLICIVILFFTFLSCCEDCENQLDTANNNLIEANESVDSLCSIINNIFESENENILTTNRTNTLTLCDFESEAVIKKDTWYITKYKSIEGKAFLKIPIPKGHTISKAIINKETNTVTFNVVGKDYTKEFEYAYKYVSGLSNKPGSFLNVDVIFNYQNDECKDIIGVLTEKKKGSVVGGVPFSGN